MSPTRIYFFLFFPLSFPSVPLSLIFNPASLFSICLNVSLREIFRRPLLSMTLWALSLLRSYNRNNGRYSKGPSSIGSSPFRRKKNYHHGTVHIRNLLLASPPYANARIRPLVVRRNAAENNLIYPPSPNKNRTEYKHFPPPPYSKKEKTGIKGGGELSALQANATSVFIIPISPKPLLFFVLSSHVGLKLLPLQSNLSLPALTTLGSRL